MIPALLEKLGLLIEDHALVYFGLLVGSFFLMLPLIFKFRGASRLVNQLLPAVLIIGASLLTMMVSASLLPFLFALLIFFVGFNYLEATLPTLVSQIATEAHRGAAKAGNDASALPRTPVQVPSLWQWQTGRAGSCRH